MTKKRLKDWVLPTLGMIVLAGSLFLYYMIGSILNDNLVPEDTMFVDILQSNERTIEVNKEVTIKEPYSKSVEEIIKEIESAGV